MSLDALIADAVADAVAAAFERHATVDTPVAVSVPRAARMLDVSPKVIRDLVAAGRLPTVALDVRRQVIPVEALRRFANGDDRALKAVS